MTNDQVAITAAACARKFGTTVRTLRVYEAKGFITPQRAANGWRVYGPADQKRLGEVLALKALGLRLSQIATVLTAGGDDFALLLSAHQAELTKRRHQIDAALERVDRLAAQLDHGVVLPVGELIALTKETNAMTTQPTAIAWKRYEQMRPRSAVAMPPNVLQDLPGHYLFIDGSVCEVTQDDGALFLRMMDQHRAQLFTEGPDQFFFQVVPAQVTAQRDGADVTGITLHQHGLDIVGHVTDADTYASILAKRRAQTSRTVQHPDSAAYLRKVIAGQIAGQPCLDMMTPTLAALVVEHQDTVTQELTEAGAMTSITFERVDTGGCDVFRVLFARLTTEWGISVNADRIIDALYFAPRGPLAPDAPAG